MTGAEDRVERATIAYFQALGYAYKHGTDLDAERTSRTEVIFHGRLREAIERINPTLTAAQVREVSRKVTDGFGEDLGENNHAFHRILTEGVKIQVHVEGSGVEGRQAWMVDFNNPDNNDWLVTNQLTIDGPQKTHRPDVIVYLNGLPVAVFELKSPESDKARLMKAWNQLQTYKSNIPDLFNTNEILVISDGSRAKMGSLTAGFERFMPWRTVDGKEASKDIPPIEVITRGIFEKKHFLAYLKHFILFETHRAGVHKIIAGYHQVRAVTYAVESCRENIVENGEKRLGVVWHTTGAGKSLSMVFFTGWVIREEQLNNPTVVVLTDRIDLDDQLFDQFALATDLIPSPTKAEDREHLKKLLHVSAGGIVFSTIQKFQHDKEHLRERYPTLTERSNVIVLADEAHRSHYSFQNEGAHGGLAQNIRDALPNAAFLGFTGTPLEEKLRVTKSVFGRYLDRYTIKQAQDDGIVVPLRYESRMARIDLPESKRPVVDRGFEYATEGALKEQKSHLKTSHSQLEALVGSEERLSLVAHDLVRHWERRQEVIDGKAMIVCMSRQICSDLYEKIVAIRPEWKGETVENGVRRDDLHSGVIKVVFTGDSSDPEPFQKHIRTKSPLKVIEDRFKDAEDPLKLVIVCDMWLTGFNVPSAHTLYLDKPIKSHNLIQAVSRINRVFKDKPSGLIVDYLGLAFFIEEAIRQYTRDSGDDQPVIDKELGLSVLNRKLRKVRKLFDEYAYGAYLTSTDAGEQLRIIQGAMNHVEAGGEKGRKAFLDAMGGLNKATALALHHEEARELVDEVGFFQTVWKTLRKQILTRPTSNAMGDKDIDTMSSAIRTLVSDNIRTSGLTSLLGEMGRAVDITDLDRAKLKSEAGEGNEHLQMALLKRILNDEIASRFSRNIAEAKRFSEMLVQSLAMYQNRTADVEGVIQELLKLKDQIAASRDRGEALGLDEREIAFFDALVSTQGVQELLDELSLANIARELTRTIRNSATIDWHKKENRQAEIRSQLKRLLRKLKFPREKRAEVIELVMYQAEQFAGTLTTTTPEVSMLTRSQTMQRLGIEVEVLEMLIDRKQLKTDEEGAEQKIFADSISIYEQYRRDQADALDEMAELTEELAILGLY